MSRIVSIIFENHRRNLLVSVAVVFVLLTSCPVKSAIKTLAGIPVNTEQGQTKKNSITVVNSAEQCSYPEGTDTKIFLSTSTHTSSLLPIFLFTAIFIFGFGFTLIGKQTHPVYGNLRIAASIPIFLQYRRLLI